LVRALDGHLAEASYRDIAEVLFGTRRIERETWKTSSLRDRTIRLVRGGIDFAPVTASCFAAIDLQSQNRAGRL